MKTLTVSLYTCVCSFRIRGPCKTSCNRPEINKFLDRSWTRRTLCACGCSFSTLDLYGRLNKTTENGSASDTWWPLLDAPVLSGLSTLYSILNCWDLRCGSQLFLECWLLSYRCVLSLRSWSQAPYYAAWNSLIWQLRLSGNSSAKASWPNRSS